MKMSRGFLAVWPLVFLASGCAGTLDRADRAFEEGRLGDAAAEYEAFLLTSEVGPQTHHARFRLAMAYALPTNSVHDEAAALLLLEELSSRGDESPYAQQATLILDLENRARAARKVAREQKLELERVAVQIEEGRLDLELCRCRLADANLLKTSRLAELEALRREVERLTREIADHRWTIYELQEDLEQLKRIDIETP